MNLPRLLPVLALGAFITHAEPPHAPADLFQTEKVWKATVSFDSEQWKRLQPEMPAGGGFPFGGPPGGGGPGGPGGQRGPGGPGGPPPGGPGGPGGGGFGPGNFLAGGFVSGLDANKDGDVSREEFVGGFDKWFTDWDATKSDALGSDALRDGFTKALAGPGGGPGGGGQGPGLQGREGQRNGLSAARGISFEYAKGTLNFEGAELKEVAVRYKGNGTFMDATASDKKSLKLNLNEFIKGQKVSGLSKLNFHNNVTDVAAMHEPISYELYRAAGVPAPRTAYVKVTLNADGAHTNRFLGLYSIVENPDNQWAEHNFKTKKGAIFKPVTRELFKYQGEDWAKYNQAYDPKTELTAKQKQRVFDFAKLVTEASDEDFARRLPEFLDIDEFSRFMATTVWLSSTDSILMMGQNFIVYLNPKTDRFLFVPWDLDRSFGNFFTPSPEKMSIKQAWAEDNRFLERAMKVPAVNEAYRARLKEFSETIFKPEKIGARVDQLARILRPIVQEEDPGKVERFDKFVAGIVPEQPANEGPGGFPRRFGMQAKPIKVFVKERSESVLAQLAGKEEGQPLGGGFGPGGGGRGGRGGGMRFGPGNIVGPPIHKAADANADTKVSKAEFHALAERWFKEWDKEGSGKLSQQNITAGLNAVIPPPDFGR